jgi:bacteriocin-like protein
MRELTDKETKQVSGGAPPKQGSGKNEAGKKVDVFAGNPHLRPGANAKETP